MKRLNKKGFTLVELLAVIVILALLMTVAFSAIPDIQGNARQKAYTSEATKMASKAIEDYQMKQIDPTKTTYTYGGGSIVEKADSTTTPSYVTFKEKNFTMNATIKAGAVDAYCIVEKDGTKVIGSLDSATGTYAQGKDCNGVVKATS